MEHVLGYINKLERWPNGCSGLSCSAFGLSPLPPRTLQRLPLGRLQFLLGELWLSNPPFPSRPIATVVFRARKPPRISFPNFPLPSSSPNFSGSWIFNEISPLESWNSIVVPPPENEMIDVEYFHGSRIFIAMIGAKISVGKYIEVYLLMVCWSKRAFIGVGRSSVGKYYYKINHS